MPGSRLGLDAFGLRSALCEVAQTVYTQFNRDERLLYDH